MPGVTETPGGGVTHVASVPSDGHPVFVWQNEELNPSDGGAACTPECWPAGTHMVCVLVCAHGYGCWCAHVCMHVRGPLCARVIVSVHAWLSGVKSARIQTSTHKGSSASSRFLGERFRWVVALKVGASPLEGGGAVSRAEPSSCVMGDAERSGLALGPDPTSHSVKAMPEVRPWVARVRAQNGGKE